MIFKEVEKREGIKSEDQTLIFNGKTLKQKTKKLIDYGIGHGCRIILVNWLLGG